MFYAIIERIRPDVEASVGAEEAMLLFSAIDGGLDFISLGELSSAMFMVIVSVFQKTYKTARDDMSLINWHNGIFIEKFRELIELLVSDPRCRPMP